MRAELLRSLTRNLRSAAGDPRALSGSVVLNRGAVRGLPPAAPAGAARHLRACPRAPPVRPLTVLLTSCATQRQAPCPRPCGFGEDGPCAQVRSSPALLLAVLHQRIGELFQV